MERNGEQRPHWGRRALVLALVGGLVGWIVVGALGLMVLIKYAPDLGGPPRLPRRSHRLARGRPDPRRARCAGLWGAVRGRRRPGHLVGLVLGVLANQGAGLPLVAPSLIDPDEFRRAE